MLIVDGFQLPTIPLGEVVFKKGAVAPVHKISVVAKSGRTNGSMVTFKVVAVVHCPAFGVKR